MSPDAGDKRGTTAAGAPGFEELPEELQKWAFDDIGPWEVDVSGLSWRAGIAELRRGTSAQVPWLLRRHRMPPGRRAIRVGAELGFALCSWYLKERRRALGSGMREVSRAGLSRRLRKAFERLGPTYIKLGQILSSGEGLFPSELVSQFRLLRDRVPPEAFDDVRVVVEEDLGRPLEAVFSSFDREPLAAASIAQVHAAVLASGEHVVVKVQRPNVASSVTRDLAAMSWIAPALVGRIPVSGLANPPALVELFAETIVEELDFRLEADNMLDVAHVLASTGQRSIVVPRPHPLLVTRRLLVMERLDGFSWDDVKSMRRAGIDTASVVRGLLIAFLEGAALYGVFHGDLHGGNLFVRRDGRVALLDYGITGRLDDVERVGFLRLLMGASMNDPLRQLEALTDLGALPRDADLPALVSDLGLDQPAEDIAKMDPDELLRQVRELTKKLLAYGAKFPKVLMLFVKDLLFVDGALATLAPDVDLFAEVAAVAAYFTQRHGERIARDVGIDPREHPLEVDAVRATLGVDATVEHLTYMELQERRELIRRRMERHRRSARTTATAGTAVARWTVSARRRASALVRSSRAVKRDGPLARWIKEKLG